MASNTLHGVNLTGWLTLESWVTPELFAEAGALDEEQLVRALGRRRYADYVRNHRATFVTRDDLARIAARGFNAVRLPVPWYVYGEEGPEPGPYQGCIELMIALGLEDHVIASYGLDNEVKDEWKAGFGKMHYDESVFAPDKETVTMLEPDMIFSWTSYFGEKKLGDVYGWHDKGVATYIAGNSGAAPDRTLENEYTDILNIGKIFHVEDKAEALVEEMKAAVADTLAAVEGQDSVTVAVVEPLGGSISNYGANSLAGDMVTQLGGTLVKPEGNEMGKEDLVTLDPDVIFVVYMAYSGDDPETVMANQLAVIQDDPALASLSAVANNRVHLIMLGDMYASGSRTIDGIRTFAQGMYPDLLS